MTSGNKQYGLFVPQKGSALRGTAATRTNVFGDDSDSDLEEGGDWVKKTFKLGAGKSIQKNPIMKTQVKKALEQDPTVFQYDEVYDDMEQNKAESKAVKKGVEKKPRYIQALLQTAERRKRENERRVEREVQKEREEEGNEFADKESFVTASYRAKLEEFKKQEEEEKRMERLEAIGDVTKQKDLTGFYRHLYRQTMGETLLSASIKGKEEIKTEPDDEIAHSGTDEPNPSTASPDKLDSEVVAVKKKDRHYRKRRSCSSSSSDESGGENTKNNGKEGEHTDADSDFTDSSTSSESTNTESGSEEGEIKKKKGKNKKSQEENVASQKKRKLQDNIKVGGAVNDSPEEICSRDNGENPEEANITDVKKPESTKESNPVSSSEAPVDDKIEEDQKPKINIWAKRTVSQALDDAVKRYYQRKAIRVSARVAGRA